MNRDSDSNDASSFPTTNYLSLLVLSLHATDEVTRTLARRRLLDNLEASQVHSIESANEEDLETSTTLV